MKKILTILFSVFCLAGFAQINVGTNFNITAQKAIDTRMVVNDTAARNAISSMQRYNGMFTYVISDSTLYQLVNGITNSHWKEFSSGAAGLFTTRGTNVTPIDSTKGIMLRDVNQVPVNRFLSNGIIGNSSSIVTNTPWGQKTNLFTNPSFESYTNDMLYFNNYESMTFGNSTDRTYDTSSNAYHGNFSLFLDTANGDPTRPQQTINVSPSTNYVVSVYGYGIGADDSLTIDIRDDDNNVVWDFTDSTWKQSDSIIAYKSFLMTNGAWGRIECPYITTTPSQSSFHVEFGMKENTRAGFIDAIQVDTGVAAQAFAENGIWHNASFERFFMYKPFGFENTTPSTSYFNYFESSTNWSAGDDAVDGVRSLQINIDPYGSPLILTNTITGLLSNTATFSYNAKANTNDTSYVAYLLIDGNTIFDMGNTRVWNFVNERFEYFDLRYGISSIAPYITVDTCYDTYERHAYTFSSQADYLQQFTVMMFFGNLPPLIPIIGGDTISIDSWQIEAGKDTTQFNNIYCRNAFANPMFQYTDDTTYWQEFTPGDEDTNSLSALQYVNDALSPTGTAMLLTTDDSASAIGLTQAIELEENYNCNVSFYARGRQAHDTIMFAIINADSLDSHTQYMWNFITNVWDLTMGGPGMGNILTYALDTTYQRLENNFIPRGNQNNYYPIMITGDIGMGNKSQAGDSIYFQGFQLEAGDTCTDVFYNNRYTYNIGHAIVLNSDTGTRLGSEWYKEDGDGRLVITNNVNPQTSSFIINRDFGVQISANVKSDEDVFKIENNNESLLKYEIGDTKHELNIENTDLAFRDSTSDARLSLDNGSLEVTVDTFRINNYALPLTSGSGYYYMNAGQTSLVAGPGGSNWNLTIGNDIYNNNTGNVGIGTMFPGEKLEVTGNAKVNGDVYGDTAKFLDYKGHSNFSIGTSTDLVSFNQDTSLFNGMIRLQYGEYVNYIDTTSNPTMNDKGDDSSLVTTEYLQGKATSLWAGVEDTISYYYLNTEVDSLLSLKQDTSDFNAFVTRFESDSIAKNDSLSNHWTVIGNLETRFTNDSTLNADTLYQHMIAINELFDLRETDSTRTQDSIAVLRNDKVNYSDSTTVFMTPTQYYNKRTLASTIRTMSSGDMIQVDPDTTIIYVKGAVLGNTILTSIPQINNTGGGYGYDNNTWLIVCTSDDSTLTIQSSINLSNGGIKLNGGVDCTLGKGQTLEIMKYPFENYFIEISRSLNQ